MVGGLRGVEVAAGVAALLDVWVGVRYGVKLLRGEARPRLATWLIFEIGVGMSLAAYFASGHHSVVKAALNVTDAVVVTVIVALLVSRRQVERPAFTRMEQLCLLISCVSLGAWAMTKTAWVGYVGFQVVMCVAYVPTIESMWRWKGGRSPEPVETWGINAVAALIAVVTDVVGRRDSVAMIYPLRALVLCVVVVALAVRWEGKSRGVVAKAG